MLRERDNVERQLGEQKMALDQQKKRYEEMQVRGMRERVGLQEGVCERGAV